MAQGNIRPLIFILDTHTGKSVESSCQKGNRWWWEEGNAGCDCNRAMFSNNNYYGDYPCGDTRYQLVNADNTPYDGWEPEEEE